MNEKAITKAAETQAASKKEANTGKLKCEPNCDMKQIIKEMDEMILLRCFRMLPTAKKQRIIGIMQAYADVLDTRYLF